MVVSVVVKDQFLAPTTMKAVKSKSKTTIRPPGRVTRTISESARFASGTCSSSRAARHTSNVPSGKGRRLHLADLKRDGDIELLGAASGLSEHDLTRIKPDKTASRTDEFHHVEHTGAGTAANVEDRRSRCQSDPFQYEPLARLDR